MPPNVNFKSLSYDPFSIGEITDNNHNPDVNLYRVIPSLNTNYYSPNGINEILKDFGERRTSGLHINIRSMEKGLRA